MPLVVFDGVVYGHHKIRPPSCMQDFEYSKDPAAAAPRMPLSLFLCIARPSNSRCPRQQRSGRKAINCACKVFPDRHLLSLLIACGSSAFSSSRSQIYKDVPTLQGAADGRALSIGKNNRSERHHQSTERTTASADRTTHKHKRPRVARGVEKAQSQVGGKLKAR